MKSVIVTPRFIFITAIIAIAAVTRLLPHPPNFTAVAAMALFGGAYFSNRKLAFIIPLAAMFLSDVLLNIFVYNISSFSGYFTGASTIAVYFSFALIVLIGFSLRNRKKALPILGASVAAAVLFFLLTNFAVWMGSPMYPKNIAGLVLCYEAAIPFFNNGLLGNLLYTTLLFGSFYLVRLKFPALAEVKPR